MDGAVKCKVQTYSCISIWMEAWRLIKLHFVCNMERKHGWNVAVIWLRHSYTLCWCHAWLVGIKKMSDPNQKPLTWLTSVHILMSSILLACVSGAAVTDGLSKQTVSRYDKDIAGSGWMFVSASKRIRMITTAWVQFPVHKACVCAEHRNLLPARTCNHVTLHHKQTGNKPPKMRIEG